ncbi:hypothetical protein ANCCAN_03769 [Ancylostoma caninum]|uniref:Receptor L-domain domain-containing protein n=1 Tax=Ancylostoma caninum TaxID=29170 RepID=A0A368H0Q6_ANCCA|nr:hypothetical protein ANCCAN_03769 [Ancylostoma caninum]
MTINFVAECVIGLLLETFLVYAQSSGGKICEFDDDIVVNSTTISLFPTGAEDYCYRVVASIRIDETSDVTHEQLHDAFGRLENLEGTLEVVNTVFTNISFFSSLFFIFRVHDGGFGYDLIIMNNSKLETMAGGALLTTSAVYIRIENNPLLDPNCTHVLERYDYNRRIRGNRFNCGCELDGIPLTNTTINDIEDNCAAILGALYIFGPYTPAAEILMRKFGNARVAYGEIAVVDTDFENLGFLRNIERVNIPYSRTGESDLSTS